MFCVFALYQISDGKGKDIFIPMKIIYHIQYGLMLIEGDLLDRQALVKFTF